MCEWNFTPNEWGGIGFSDESAQNKVAVKGSIVAIYVAKHTKVKAAKKEKKPGMVVGFVEISGKKGDISKFISWKILIRHLKKPDNHNRWPYATGISRAWKVKKTDWKIVDDVFPNTYKNNASILIGRNTVIVVAEDFANIKRLRIEAVEVYQPPNGLPAEQYAIEKYETAGELLKNRGLLDE